MGIDFKGEWLGVGMRVQDLAMGVQDLGMGV